MELAVMIVCACIFTFFRFFFPGVSGGGEGGRWPAAGSGALSAAVRAWDLLKEVNTIFIASTVVWPRVKQQEGNTAHQEKIRLNIY